ncbi:hypothetical protein [Winogradskyella alexanderae]|uniref:Uncharacterized protein n=1 Tax=Winogradskyella alexanderae TaxID=2877123 RepID=A0ABS7XP43_9FLAO|nr:hypothetical protein [Winogradskyella alexanderae]MCA0131761.1 hypothetical protein [Winogradskyella alexanderae]
MNDKLYDINIGDIWNFEQTLFQENQISENHVRELFQRIEDIIIHKGQPFLSTEDYDNGGEEYRRNFRVYVTEFRDSLGDFKTRYTLNYFFTNEYAYYYNQVILIDKEFNDFDFWFTCKLRQFDSKLTNLNKFLDFQLKLNFGKNISNYVDFLKAIMIQYENELLNKRLIESLNYWIESNKNGGYFEGRRKLKGKYSSLRLRELNSNPDYLKKNSHILNTVLKQLKANNFIHEETLFTDFNRIFEGNVIPENKRIVWTGTNKDLKWFMDYLCEGSNKIEYHKHDKWILANMCFVNKENQEFAKDVLRKASGGNEVRKKLLESILTKI